MKELYSTRTRKEAKEIRKEEQREERNKRFIKNLPLFLLFLGIFTSILCYAICINNEYNEMRKEIINDKNIPIKIREKYMTHDEIKNMIYKQK